MPNNIFQKKITPFMFQSDDAVRVMTYARDTYGDYVEFLWERFPKYAVLRRQDTGKWYGALMALPRAKVGLSGAGEVEVLNVRATPETVVRLIERGMALPAYHMQKKRWMTLPLDGRFPGTVLTRLIDDSYRLAVKK